MSDRIGVMSNGPSSRWERRPKSTKRPAICSSPLYRRIEPAGRDGAGEHGQIGRIGPGDGTRVPAPPRAGLAAGQRVKLVIRPENVFLDGSEAGQFRLPAVVDAKIYQGALIRYRLTVAANASSLKCRTR